MSYTIDISNTSLQSVQGATFLLLSCTFERNCSQLEVLQHRISPIEVSDLVMRNLAIIPSQLSMQVSSEETFNLQSHQFSVKISSAINICGADDSKELDLTSVRRGVVLVVFDLFLYPLVQVPAQGKCVSSTRA